MSRLVFTCRYPFTLPDDRHESAAGFHLGPLSWAETRKLFWRLDGLKVLSPEDSGGPTRKSAAIPRARISRCAPARRQGALHRRAGPAANATEEEGIDPARWCAEPRAGSTRLWPRP